MYGTLESGVCVGGRALELLCDLALASDFFASALSCFCLCFCSIRASFCAFLIADFVGLGGS